MSQDPSPYDLLQDNQISALQDIVTPYYTPPGDVEYSFPVVGQGITADQYRLMSLGQANGIIHGDNGVVNDSPNSTGYRYYLEGHATDAETNQRNTLMLRAGTSAEAILEGFYHRLSEDMELSFPSVTTATTYHVCLTYDPRREDEPTGPIHVEVYAGEPPTTHGRVHLILHTVERQPNQLLSQASITRYRSYTAGIVGVQNTSQLPDVDSYPAGTLAVPSSTEATGIYVRSNTSPKRWINTMKGPWEQIPGYGGWDYSYRVYRRTAFGVDVSLRAQKTESTNNHRVASLPFNLTRLFDGPPVYAGSTPRPVRVGSNGVIYWDGPDVTSGWVTMHFTIPDYFIAD